MEKLDMYLTKKILPQAQFTLRTIDRLELRKLLIQRKGNRSSGIDFIDGYAIKLAAPIIEDVLLHLVNLSITSSRFPTSGKTNKVSPHFNPT